ncbi:hypothetical protein VF04_01015 [Nostoc linckia z7]|jgi:hypothetical protein|uniref:Uncharacterized protein n=2 Tax=Nostoc linckia TaxID=92942 RepID=A0A9Q5ZH36_NOSLI|nr:hypothetical protein [Nostoc linckia]PHK41450.1 hypothetical protein VF12_06525 [Nostoc linckia z15]PHK46951.1 hypothetical protein VF13_08185 [Nostoc linckia z16]PHJ73364.1 hypothetical protein VF05_02030 [Nostoc linckia z3]PHJ78711.1 hypothetical protein VF03_01015 [Nostoc linckia z2]PHJ85815.1 hypothetical protein VF06_06335 [Nostoc linckia z4]
MNPSFLAPKKPYISFDNCAHIRCWAWSMLNLFPFQNLECRLVIYFADGGGRWFQLRMASDWFVNDLRFCFPSLVVTAVLPDDAWREYGRAYGLSEGEIENLSDPIPF